jgi:hypothetical protein
MSLTSMFTNTQSKNLNETKYFDTPIHTHICEFEFHAFTPSNNPQVKPLN